MQSHNVPLPRWLDLVAPLAYHYFPKSGHVGCQYPPGTGLVLALFPKGKAVIRLNKTVIAFFLGIGLTLLILAGARQLWAPAGFIALVSYLGMRIIGRIDRRSFSINAVLPMLLLAFLCVFVALWIAVSKGNRRLAWVFSLLGGLFFGLAILIRLPIAFLGPSILVLLWPGTWEISVRNKFLPFAIGTVTGIIPVFVFQQYEAGAWYLPSYGPWDTMPPGLQSLKSNLSYYLGTGPGSTDNWALVACIIGLIGIAVLSDMKPSKDAELTWKRLTGSALLLWTVPTTYFLTHETIIPYYSVPGTFGTVMLLALGVFSIEWFVPRARIHEHRTQNLWLCWTALALSLVPGITVLTGGWPPALPSVIQMNTPRPRAHLFELPPRLAEARAWIWADFLTGTLWYYSNKSAFKIATTDTATRAMVYRFVFERGEPQYLIQDSPHMNPIMDEISRMGGVLEPIPGGIESCPYFLIHWPKNGPQWYVGVH